MSSVAVHHENTKLIPINGFPSYNGNNNGTGSLDNQQSAISVNAPTISNLSEQRPSVGHATVLQTSLNIAKTCMGTGTLALPFAASQGGYLFSTVGIATVSLWNLYCVDRLIKCASIIASLEAGPRNDIVQHTENGNHKSNAERQHRKTRSRRQKFFQSLPSDRIIIEDVDDDIFDVVKPPPNISKFSLVVWHSCGRHGVTEVLFFRANAGLHVFDTIMMILLFGIIIAYEDAAISFIAQTRFTTGSTKLDAVGIIVLIAPITCVPNVGFLNKFSAVGILAIILAFAAIFGYGFSFVISSLDSNAAYLDGLTFSSLWPASVTGVANWFGVVAFSFGMVPLTFNFQDSMTEPQYIIKAMQNAAWLVLITYLIISNGVAILFSTAPHSFEGDVLLHLPNSWISTMTRVVMTLVVVVTSPLIVIPCSEIIEGRAKISAESKLSWRIFIRIGICSISSGLSVLVPGFVIVISLIGCCCVALVSFTFPPFFYILLTIKSGRSNFRSSMNAKDEEQVNTVESFPEKDLQSLRLDYAMLLWGVFATVVTSYLTLMNVIQQSLKGK